MPGTKYIGTDVRKEVVRLHEEFRAASPVPQADEVPTHPVPLAKKP